MVEWIEIGSSSRTYCTGRKSPPSWWSGLKYREAVSPQALKSVSTLVVEWIEISYSLLSISPNGVSTLVVEWIEILGGVAVCSHFRVSTLVVEWIEIGGYGGRSAYPMSPPSWWSGLKYILISPVALTDSLHPRGGVD